MKARGRAVTPFDVTKIHKRLPHNKIKQESSKMKHSEATIPVFFFFFSLYYTVYGDKKQYSTLGIVCETSDLTIVRPHNAMDPDDLRWKCSKSDCVTTVNSIQDSGWQYIKQTLNVFFVIDLNENQLNDIYLFFFSVFSSMPVDCKVSFICAFASRMTAKTYINYVWAHIWYTEMHLSHHNHKNRLSYYYSMYCSE